MANPAFSADLWDRCFAAAAARLAQLDLDGLEDRVHERKIAEASLASEEFPCLLLTLDGLSIEANLLDTGNDETVLPVAVEMWDRESQADSDEDLLDRWRKRCLYIAAAFRARSWSALSLSECWKAEAGPFQPLARSARSMHQATGRMIVRFRCLTARAA